MDQQPHNPDERQPRPANSRPHQAHQPPGIDSSRGPELDKVASILPDLARAYRGRELVCSAPLRIQHTMGSEQCERLALPFIGIFGERGEPPQLELGVAFEGAGQHILYPAVDPHDLVGALRAMALLRLLPALDRRQVMLVVESASTALPEGVRQSSRAALVQVIAEGHRIEPSRAREQLDHQLKQPFGDIEEIVERLGSAGFPFRGISVYLAMQQGLIQRRRWAQAVAHSTVDLLAGVRSPEPMYEPLWQRASEGLAQRTLAAARRMVVGAPNPVRPDQVEAAMLAFHALDAEVLRKIATGLLALGHQVRLENPSARALDSFLGEGASTLIASLSRDMAGTIINLATRTQVPPKRQLLLSNIQLLTRIQDGFERIDQRLGSAVEFANRDPDSQVGDTLAEVRRQFKLLLAPFNRHVRESFVGVLQDYPERLSQQFHPDRL